MQRQTCPGSPETGQDREREIKSREGQRLSQIHMIAEVLHDRLEKEGTSPGTCWHSGECRTHPTYQLLKVRGKRIRERTKA